jgi:hypothetical protein
MSLLDLVVLFATLLIVLFLHAPLLPALTVACAVVIVLRVARGERIP